MGLHRRNTTASRRKQIVGAWFTAGARRPVALLMASRARVALAGTVVASFALVATVAPASSQAALTHEFKYKIENVGPPRALTVGPAEPEPAAEKSALFVANGSEVERYSATGAELPFTCVAAAKCPGYVAENKIKGIPGAAPGEVAAFRYAGGVAVDDETGEIYVSAETAIDIFASTGEYLGQITEVPAGAGVPGPFYQTSGLAFDQDAHQLYVADDSNVSVVDIFKREAPGKAEYVSQFATSTVNTQTLAVAESGLGVPAGTVYDAYFNGSVGVVNVFSSLGTLESEWKGGKTLATSFGTPSVGIDPVTGHVYVADENHRSVDEFGASVSEESLGRLTGTPAGQFSGPRAVAIGREGEDEYVGDYNEEANSGVVDVYGPDLELPEVQTQAATGVEPNTATLNGMVSTGKGGAATCKFVWGTSEALGESAVCEPNPVEGEGQPVSAKLGENGQPLQPDTKYYYRLQATYTGNAAAVNLGEEATAECEGKPSEDGCFTTPGPGVESESVTDVAASSATFDASVDPNNAATSYFFQYSTGDTEACTADPAVCTSAPAAPGSSLGSGKGAVPVEQHIQGLSGGTSYHYRVVAISEISSGTFYTTYGVDQVFTTQSVGSASLLIDGRAYEQVSPPSKQGALVEGLRPSGITQAAADGGAMTYLVNVPTERGVAGYSNQQQVLSTRAAGGWSSVDLATPHNGAVSASVNAGQEYRFFSEDLSRAVLQPFGAFEPCHNASGAPQPCLSEAASEQTAFLANLEGTRTSGAPPTYAPLVSLADDTSSPFEAFGQEGVKEGGACPPEKFCGPFFDGATKDASHVVLSSDLGVQLTGEGATSGASGSLYEWSAGVPAGQQLQLVSVLPGGAPETKHAALGTLVNQNGAGGDGEDARHAISTDGSRVFWTGSDGTLYMRDMPQRESIQIGGGGGAASFQFASADGARVFFTEGAGLFECEIPAKLECNAVRLGEVPAGLIVGGSEDGSYVYWVARDRDLYLDHYDGSARTWAPPRLIAALSEEDGPDWGGNGRSPSGLAARVSPDGQWLAFMSDRPLTGYDNQDSNSGVLDEEVFLYSAETGRTSCASCDPTGARPTGVASQQAGLVEVDRNGYEEWLPATWLSGVLPAWDAFETLAGGVSRYQPRYLSNEGRLFFNSDDALVPKDINENWDVYEYEPAGYQNSEGIDQCTPTTSSGKETYKPARTFHVPAEGAVPAAEGEEGAGCVGLISSGESPQESAFLDASETGGDVFFMTTAQLSSADFDNSYDVYDAHECTAASPCIPPPAGPAPACETAEACRTAPTPQPGVYGAPASATFNGIGNLAPAAPKPAVKKVTKKAAKCPKGKVRRTVKPKKGKPKSECVRKPKHKKNR